MVEKSNDMNASQIMHVVVVKFHNEASKGKVDEIRQALEDMAQEMPYVTSYRCGGDLGLTDGAWDFTAVGTVASEEDLNRYLDHPRHLQIVNDLIVPILVDRTVVQTRIPA